MAETIGTIDATVSCYLRMDNGQFMSRLETAERIALEETKDEGVAMAISMAPKKTGAMASTIHGTVGASGCSWSVDTNHWQYTELGARPHHITGAVSFFWEKMGRRWTPGSNIIHHPGTRAIHFMHRSWLMAAPKLLDRIKRNLG